MSNSENWTMIIKPKRNLLDINLREVWRYRDLISLFVRRDFVSKFKQTILGPLWFIINPLFTTLMYFIVFSKIAKLSTDGLPPILFYLSGIVAWQYFSGSLNSTANTFIANAGIFGKVYFPRLVTPISVVISNLIQFGIQFMLFVVIYVYYLAKGVDIQPNIYALLIPVLIVMMALLGLGFGIIISSLTTKYRDLSNLISFGVQLWMYVTPVIYPTSMLSQKYQFFILINPLTSIIETFRYGLLGQGTIDFAHLAYSGGFTLVVLTLGIVLFNKVEQTFMDTV